MYSMRNVKYCLHYHIKQHKQRTVCGEWYEEISSTNDTGIGCNFLLFPLTAINIPVASCKLLSCMGVFHNAFEILRAADKAWCLIFENPACHNTVTSYRQWFTSPPHPHLRAARPVDTRITLSPLLISIITLNSWPQIVYRQDLLLSAMNATMITPGTVSFFSFKWDLPKLHAPGPHPSKNKHTNIAFPQARWFLVVVFVFFVAILNINQYPGLVLYLEFISRHIRYSAGQVLKIY